MDSAVILLALAMYFLNFNFAFESSSVIQKKLIFMLIFDQMQHEVDISLSQQCELSELRYVTWEIGCKNKEHS